MADFEHDLRQHYESQKLPDERARAILAAGRVAAAARARRNRWLLGAAAAMMVGVGVVTGVMGWGGRAERSDARRIATQDAAAAVVEYFSQPDYQIAEVSADHAALIRWLRERGGPAALAIPKAMTGLSSFGCQVLEAKGQRVFLICFFLDSLPGEPGSGAMPIKREMSVTAPDGSMMKKKRPLVHLVVAPRAAFRDAPLPGLRVQFSAVGGEWNFETWSQGDLIYLAAAAAPAERIAELVRVL